VLERFSIECRKTKTIVIILANQKGHRQSNEPIKTQSKYVLPTHRAGKSVRAKQDWFWFYLSDKVARVSVAVQNQRKIETLSTLKIKCSILRETRQHSITISKNVHQFGIPRH